MVIDDSPPELAKERVAAGLQLSGFGRPFGLAVDRNGFTYVADMDLHMVARISSDFAEVSWLSASDRGWSNASIIRSGVLEPSRPKQPRYFNGPHSVAIATDGSIWIATYYEPAIHLFDADGRLSSRYLTVGGIELAGPATARLNHLGHLLITEYRLNCVLVADFAGHALGSLGGGSVNGLAALTNHRSGAVHGAFDRPHMATELADGSYIIADTWNHRLQRFSANFQWAGWLGSDCQSWCDELRTATAGSDALSFSAPVAVGATLDGRFIVTDWGNNRLKWYDISGKVIETVEDFELKKPYDAQVLNGRLFVADSHNGRVIVANV